MTHIIYDEEGRPQHAPKQSRPGWYYLVLAVLVIISYALLGIWLT